MFLSIILVGCGENNQMESATETVDGILYEENDVHITKSGVTISNAVIEGDLYVDESVGSGEFFIEDTTVNGTIYVNGGGPNSGYLINVIGKELIIESETNPNLVLSMNTQFEGVDIACDCRLETTAENVKKVKINNSKTEQAINVIMKGDYPEVTLESTSNVMIDGKVSLLSVLKNAGLTNIEW
jgi:mannan endo-1,4-beta-mannosidase